MFGLIKTRAFTGRELLKILRRSTYSRTTAFVAFTINEVTQRKVFTVFVGRNEQAFKGNLLTKGTPAGKGTQMRIPENSPDSRGGRWKHSSSVADKRVREMLTKVFGVTLKPL
ncbi:uncharacterized protein [Macrobrachium rosenbergii]|uniref:uncharacterized protein n=1 Tax=Macrobrachium rosenbergii TaxID=79674 RepID=UPI0034D55F67